MNNPDRYNAPDQRFQAVAELVERHIARGDSGDVLRDEILGALTFDTSWPPDALRELWSTLMRVAPEADRDWIAEVARGELALLAELDAEQR